MEKIMHEYETVMVLSAKLNEEDLATMLEKFKALIAENGTLGAVEDWGKRRLAYEINDENEAYYYLVNFTSDSELPAELDRVYKITDGVLRSLIVRKDA